MKNLRTFLLVCAVMLPAAVASTTQCMDTKESILQDLWNYRSKSLSSHIKKYIYYLNLSRAENDITLGNVIHYEGGNCYSGSAWDKNGNNYYIRKSKNGKIETSWTYEKDEFDHIKMPFPLPIYVEKKLKKMVGKDLSVKLSVTKMMLGYNTIDKQGRTVIPLATIGTHIFCYHGKPL